MSTTSLGRHRPCLFDSPHDGDDHAHGTQGCVAGPLLSYLDAEWAHLAPAQRHARRQLVSRPLVDDFFAWATVQYARVKDTRGRVATPEQAATR